MNNNVIGGQKKIEIAKQVSLRKGKGIPYISQRKAICLSNKTLKSSLMSLPLVAPSFILKNAYFWFSPIVPKYFITFFTIFSGKKANTSLKISFSLHPFFFQL